METGEAEKKPILEEVLTTSHLKEVKNHYFATLEGEDMPISPVQAEKPLKLPRLKHLGSDFYKNIIGLAVLILILLTIRNIVIAGILGLSLFIFLNPIQNENGKNYPSVSFYLRKIDTKLIYFFIILFILVYFMQISGITSLIDQLVEQWGHNDVFLIAVGVMILVSVLSGFLDDAPVTILFLPVIADLVFVYLHPANPIFIAFTLGINLGGNFLPQGAACDMMTLELARKNKVPGFTYKSLTLVGGLFAVLHIVLGIGYVWLYLRLFPM